MPRRMASTSAFDELDAEGRRDVPVGSNVSDNEIEALSYAFDHSATHSRNTSPRNVTISEFQQTSGATALSPVCRRSLVKKKRQGAMSDELAELDSVHGDLSSFTRPALEEPYLATRLGESSLMTGARSAPLIQIEIPPSYCTLRAPPIPRFILPPPKPSRVLPPPPPMPSRFVLPPLQPPQPLEISRTSQRVALPQLADHLRLIHPQLVDSQPSPPLRRRRSEGELEPQEVDQYPFPDSPPAQKSHSPPVSVNIRNTQSQILLRGSPIEQVMEQIPEPPVESNLDHPLRRMIVLTGKDLTQVKHRRRISEKEFKVLEETFQNNPKPGLTIRQSLAHQFGMTPRSVEIWFQNRRAKAKQEGKRLATKLLATSSASIPTPSSSRPSSSDNSSQPAMPLETDLPTPPQSPPTCSSSTLVSINSRFTSLAPSRTTPRGDAELTNENIVPTKAGESSARAFTKYEESSTPSAERHRRGMLVNLVTD